MTICKLFFEKFPYFSVKTLKNNIYKAQYIYDITCILNYSQIFIIKTITIDNIHRVVKKDITKVVNYCK